MSSFFHLLSKMTGHLADLKEPQPISRLLIQTFANAYGINRAEAEKEMSEYASLTEFFSRRLKPGSRPIHGEPIHPVDGTILSHQPVTGRELLQAKGHRFSLDDLLLAADSQALFAGGAAITYYLCPADYHRIHAPVAGAVTSVTYVPGALWPVNGWSVRWRRELYSRNERVVIQFETGHGPVAVVLVGATNVGRIAVPWVPALTHGHRAAKIFQKFYETPQERPRFAAGDELGAFLMGSTVIVLYGARWVELGKREPSLAGQVVRMGEGASP